MPLSVSSGDKAKYSEVYDFLSASLAPLEAKDALVIG